METHAVAVVNYTNYYADDTLILTENARDLQCALDALKVYCDKWKLTVNAQKTKIVVFSRGKIRNLPKLKYDGQDLEVVFQFPYLGITLNYNGKMKKAISDRIDLAKKAAFCLITKAKNLMLPLDIVIELFEKAVVPVLCYGCEVWG